MKVLYLSFSNLDHSLNAVYIKGLRANGVEVQDFYSNRSRLGKYLDVLKFYRSKKKDVDFIVVGYDSPGLVIWLRTLLIINSAFFRDKGQRGGPRNSARPKQSVGLIYNALCSIIERIIISRGLARKYSLKYWYYWGLDFLAVHLSYLTMVESNEQIKFFKQTFLVSDKKLFRAWTGVDEDKFYYDANIKKHKEFTVIFRGRLLPEAGGEYVVRAAKLLEHENIKIIMHAFGQEQPQIESLIKDLHPSNLQLVTDFLPIEQVKELMQKCHLSLGQLSDHNRLDRTIPHKAYETLALKIAYLTARNKAVLELLVEDETCLACQPADPTDLAKKILWARDHPTETNLIASSGHQLYKDELISEKLAENLLKQLKMFG